MGDETADLIIGLIGMNALNEGEIRNFLANIACRFQKPETILESAEKCVRALFMCSKLNILLCVLALTLPASAQLNSGQLRAKFGAPLSREIFRVSPGFDLVADYGADNQVCRLQVPALMPTEAKVQNTDDMKKKMHAFLAELVPDLTRGKELGRFMSQTGAFSGVGFDEYEHVTFVETYSGSKDTITVTFKSAGCQRSEQIAR
jgi:hypothetical protein